MRFFLIMPYCPRSALNPKLDEVLSVQFAARRPCRPHPMAARTSLVRTSCFGMKNLTAYWSKGFNPYSLPELFCGPGSMLTWNPEP